MTVFQKSDARANELTHHLESWGLRRFTDETSYYRWQQDVLTKDEIAELNQLAQARSGGDHQDADMSFYELAAQPKILPVLYSQRYDYFLEIGCATTDRIEPAQRVLDFGCGVGILTTFYALCFPHITFVGIDRSLNSITRARDEATKRRLSNVRFEHRHIPTDAISDSFDLIISTQTLFQAEQDSGLPSLSWKTFERADDPILQAQSEVRTGLKDRLESLSHVLSADGRMLLCEKAQHMGRRILLQRALATQGYRLVGEPVCFHYRAIDEEVEDGPLFEVSQIPNKSVWPWKEEPIIKPGESLYIAIGCTAEKFISSMTDSQITRTLTLSCDAGESATVTLGKWGGCLTYGYVQSQTGLRGAIIGNFQDEEVIQQYFNGAERWTEKEKSQVIARLTPHADHQDDEIGLPGYENHTPVAQVIWASLPDRHIQDQATFREKDGQEMHIEWGTCGPLTYLYWANTYDQCQLVLMTAHEAKVIQNYYQESLAEMRTGVT